MFEAIFVFVMFCGFMYAVNAELNSLEDDK